MQTKNTEFKIFIKFLTSYVFLREHASLPLANKKDFQCHTHTF